MSISESANRKNEENPDQDKNELAKVVDRKDSLRDDLVFRKSEILGDQGFPLIASESKKVKNNRAKSILGSVIDIRKSLYADAADKRTARYMNTYKLDSDKPFNPEKVDKILKSVMTEAFENLTYDKDKCLSQAKWASVQIRSRVKELEFERYKIVCIVTIGEKNSQDIFVACRFLWDAERDKYSFYSLENTYVFGIAQCFGIYYE